MILSTLSAGNLGHIRIDRIQPVLGLGDGHRVDFNADAAGTA
jgi:hypothetical protein